MRSEEIEITLDELLDIAEKPFRKWLREWRNEDPEGFPKIANLRKVRIQAKDAINCTILLEEE